MFFLDKKFIFAFLILALSIFFTFVFLLAPKDTKKTPPSEPVPTPIQLPTVPYQTGSDFRGIIPGSSSESNVISKLGQPIKVGVENEKKVLFYSTRSEYRFNKIFVLDSRVEYVTHAIIDDSEVGKYDDFLKKFPEGPNGIAYDSGNRSYVWYVFSAHGVAVFANPAGYILEVQYFPPMSFDGYLNSVAKDFSLSTNPPPEQL